MRTSAVGLALGGLFLFGAVGTASAQYATPSLTLTGTQKPAGVGGVRVGEGVYLRLGVTAEAGYDSNVFYNDIDKEDSATLRVTPAIEITNADRDGNSPPFHFSFGASLLYREYLKEDDRIREQRAFNPTIGGSVGYQGGNASFAVSDQFTRLEEPPYERDAEPIMRDYNLCVAQVGLAPGGGRIQSVLRYTNTLDLYENDELDYANRMGHEIMLDGSWRWLPKTALFLQGAIGYIHYLNEPEGGEPEKQNSIPFRVLAGLRGLVTPKLTATIQAGFADALYDGSPGISGANPSGLSNLAASVSLTYKPVTFTSLGLMYSHEFRDSPIIGDYYDLDAAGLSIAQQIGAFVLSALGRYEYRRYQGLTTAMMPLSRNDHVWQTTVQADYFLQRWFYAGVGYSNLINRSTEAEGTTGTGVGLDYTKHVILGRLGITY